MAANRAELIAELERMRDELLRYDRLSAYSPYPKQKEFHNAGATYRERLLSAGNQSGKTLCASFESAMHSTGRYPDWWQGKRFDRPTIGIVSGQSWQLVRDNIQRLLLGTTDIKDKQSLGTGSIPLDALMLDSLITGPVQGAFAQVRVKHVDGGYSTIHVVPYLAGRVAIQSYTADWVWCDEEPPISFYLEALTRTNVAMGPVFITFTPLLGMSDVVLRFFEPDPLDTGTKDRALIQMSLEDAYHYTPEQRAQIESSYPAHERDARCRGIPKLGAGAIYPILRESIEVEPFILPAYWPRVYGMDVGWKRTAAVWGALDRETDTLYLYHEYYVGAEKPAVHAAGIKAPGDWIPGVIDPASRGRTQTDGTALIDEYTTAGLNLQPADHAVEAGIYKVWDRLSTGRLKVFSTLRNWFSEQATYRRDETGKVVKERDHLMDACVVGETKVVTTKGAIPIASLVGRAGRVISRDGTVCWFIGARKTLENVPVVKVTFEDGSEVKCTPDHPFLTINGWVEAKDLQGILCYNGVSQSIHRKMLCKSMLLPKLVKNLKVFVTTCVDSISRINRQEIDCTGLSGRQATVPAFHLDMRYTISMGTEQTIIQKILCSWSAGSTLSTIKKGIVGGCRNKLFPLLQNGISQNKGGSGTGNTTITKKTNFIRKLNLLANSAKKSLLRFPGGIIDSVQTHANLGGVSYLALTMRNGIAWFVARCLWRIATLRNPAVQEGVLFKCVSVNEAGKDDVYCLTVPATHSFCIESGIVVHNTRYLVMSGLDVAIPAPSAGSSNRYRPGWKV